MVITTSQETGSEDYLDETLEELLAGQQSANGNAEEEAPELESASGDKGDSRRDETLTAEETTVEGEETAETSTQEADESQQADPQGAEPTDDTALHQEGDDGTGGATEEEHPPLLEASMTEGASTPQGETEESSGEQPLPATTPEEPAGDHHGTPEINGGKVEESKGDETGANDNLQKHGAEEQETTDESSDTDSDSPTYEERITDELNSGQSEEENEEILDLEELAEEDDPSRAEGFGDGQAVISTGDTERHGERKAGPAALETMQSGGLSEEERGDLEKLITDLNEEFPADVSSAVVKQIQKKMKVTEKRVAKLGKMILAYDKKLKASHEVMQLYREKTEMMNRRIDAIVAAMSNGKGT
jgi:hypothetical protein